MTVDSALTDVFWGSYENRRERDDRPEFEDRGHLSLQFWRQAKNYIALRDYRLRTAAKSTASGGKAG
jgi:hypothetical protein